MKKYEEEEAQKRAMGYGDDDEEDDRELNVDGGQLSPDAPEEDSIAAESRFYSFLV